ncbi:MAG: carboxypeptidase-like regulatory domain-containing protein, partial [Candidatus Bathyarchaeia archaeon]
MHKKLTATLTIAIFLISTFAIIVPTQAHFTLGNLSGTNPYAINNFDPHVAGPIGYVWPGSGQCAYQGNPNSVSSSCSPGYQSPYPNGNPPGAPSNSWYQLQGDTYAPFGAVLTNSTGDMIFAMNATGTPNTWTVKNRTGGALAATQGWDTWFILIPPEFNVPGAVALDSSQVVSTLTNSYDRYLVAKLGPNDRYAPNWTMVAITVDATIDANSAGSVYYNHQYINFTSAGEWYYARINGVTAPSVAGRYFFKMALYSSSNVYGVGPTLAGHGAAGEQPFVWVPPQNWPVMLVKGETDPAIITGTLRYAGYNSTLYQMPIAEAGKVRAHRTLRIDPYTGQNRPDLGTIDSQAYVNATANGHYELEGLAPGVYDIYAEAAGYPQVLCNSGITVLKGQSLHFDCFLQPGPVIHGNVYTKHQFGDEPWPNGPDGGQYIKIELYANATLSNQVDPSAGAPVSWSPLPCVAGGQEKYYGRRAADLCGDPHDGSAIAFPWHEYSTVNGVFYNDVPNPFTGATNGYSRDVAISSTLGNTLLTSDPQGVGPPQQWFVSGGTTTPFHFEFGLKGEYGAPRDLSGEVPQVYATWINGLTAGRYYVRAWIFRYVQTALDGSTFQEYYF